MGEGSMKLKDIGDSSVKLGMYLGARFKKMEDRMKIIESEFIKLRDRVSELEMERKRE